MQVICAVVVVYNMQWIVPCDHSNVYLCDVKSQQVFLLFIFWLSPR